MTHKKRSSTRKVNDYKNEKLEFANELANNTEVNTKIASQNEAKYSKKTMTKKHDAYK